MTSPAKIAEYMQVSVITVRRTLTLFNQLGVTHSVNGVGTRILGAENSMDVSNPDDSEILVSSTMETCRLPRYLTKPRQRRSEWDMAGSDGISRVSTVFRGKSLLTNKMRII